MNFVGAPGACRRVRDSTSSVGVCSRRRRSAVVRVHSVQEDATVASEVGVNSVEEDASVASDVGVHGGEEDATLASALEEVATAASAVEEVVNVASAVEEVATVESAVEEVAAVVTAVEEGATLASAVEEVGGEDVAETELCPGCGKVGGPISGCDGDSRIAGGLGAVFSWFPIKAYRPCPEYTKNKNYRRSGQSLAEIGFGRKEE